ncbi:MAG TPA: hypothetical protein DCZ10_02620 [Pelotomaculum sp.]|nr:hypothetical protein [Pelotomaculum sp.]
MINDAKMTTRELQSFMDTLQTETDIFTIGIEFFCGECCKKVTNGQFIFFIPGFILLLPPVGQFLMLRVFSDGKIVEVQKLRSIQVAIDKLCAIEGNPIQVWPACDNKL